jgi:hypothetical protein
MIKEAIMNSNIVRLVFLGAPFLFSSVFASDFDGSKALICAPVEAMDCTPGQECARGAPDDIGAPSFMRFDFSKKVVVGPKRTSPIQSMESDDSQLLLRGSELGYGWTIALNRSTGKMVVTLTDNTGAFVLFGSCTPL